MKYNNKQTYTTTREDYSESAALQDLLVAVDEELAISVARMEAGLNDYSNFTININGKSIAFILGGPQADALLAFVNHIAAENLYSVDFDKNTVDGWN